MANYDRIRDHIEHVVPDFENYNERVRQPGGFYLPNPIRDLEFNTRMARRISRSIRCPKSNWTLSSF